jgi:ribosome-binding factor A
MSPDLGLARIYLSIFPVNQTEKIMEMLNAEKSRLRGALGKRIGKQVRIVPELALFDDNTAEQASHMDQLIDSLVIPPETPEEDED